MANGENQHHACADRENCSVSGPTTDAKSKVAKLKPESAAFIRQRKTFGLICKRLNRFGELAVLQIGLCAGTVLGPPRMSRFEIRMGTIRENDEVLHDFAGMLCFRRNAASISENGRNRPASISATPA